MPRILWSCAPDTEDAARRLGPRIRRLRETRGLSIRQLADRAKISTNTLLRLEQGAPIAERLMVRLCDCLQTIPPNLLVPDEDWNRSVRVHHAEGAPWVIAFRRAKAPSCYQDFEPVENPAERARMAQLGFVSGFLQAHDCALQNGKLNAAVVELHGTQERPAFRHSGEEWVMCLSGELRLSVGDECFALRPGDSATFRSEVPHRYESMRPSTEGPTQIAMVWIEGEEDARALDYSDCPD